MTNGEKMQEMFPEGKTRRCRGGVVFESDGWCHAYDSDWWNSEYKKPTKNDPKFCPDRKAKTTHMETILHCVEDKCAAYKDGKCLKYNSDQDPTTENDLEVQKAIEIIKADSLAPYSVNDILSARDLAVEALKQMAITKNDLGVNYRSLEEIKKLVERKADELDGVMLDAGGVIIGLYFAIVNDLSPATPQEQRKGHWISHREHCENLGVMPSGLGAYEWCSNCDCGIDVREWHRNHYNFCPNCGADMREVEK